MNQRPTPKNGFEAMLSGGHPNSPGRTVEVVLGRWAGTDAALAAWLRPQAERLAGDGRKSVAANANKLLSRLDPTGAG